MGRKGLATGAALVALVSALGAGKVWSDRQEEKARFTSASESMQRALKEYEDNPSMESAINISSVLGSYVGENEREGGDTLNSLKDKLDSFCQDEACISLRKIHDQIETEERHIKALKKELDDKEVKLLLLTCKRIFEKQGDGLLVDCYDTGNMMQRLVLMVNESFASKMKMNFPFYAYAKDMGMIHVNLYNGSGEYFQSYKNINVDLDAVRKSESTLEKLRLSLSGRSGDYDLLKERSWREIEKNIEPELKAVAAMFGNSYVSYEKRVERAKESVATINDSTMRYTFNADNRRVTNHVLAGSKIIIDSRDMIYAESDPLSMVVVDGEVISQSEAIIFFEEGIVANSGAVLIYSFGSGGNSCDASTEKAIIIAPGKKAKVSPDLGWCDTTYTLNGDELTTESKEAGLVCSIRVDTGDMNCRKSEKG